VTITTKEREAAATELRSRYGVEPSLADGTVSFQVPAGEAFLPEFVRTFGQPMEAIGLRRPTLDDVFLHLTGHEIRDGLASDYGAAVPLEGARMAELYRGVWVVAYRDLLNFVSDRGSLRVSCSRSCSW
jgi:hypothetical protein